MEQISLDLDAARRVFTVSELNGAIRGTLGSEYADIWVAGEISGSKLAASGHWYFTLKDAASQLRCACFRSAARYLRFKPEDGVAVLARGRIDVFEPRGEYQLLVETLEPQGYGALQLQFEQLKRKLAAEGLFDAARKRPLPRFPRRIGIVTSPGGAVIRDILNVLERRFAGLEIRVYPAQVQGTGSIEAVCAGVEYFSGSGWADVVIVARGGGSIEDLWTFNEEAVARAIAASSVPVVSAVGHETDFTIADFVADLRAPTPSAAAELVAPERQQLLSQTAGLESKLAQATRFHLARAAASLERLGIDRLSNVLSRDVGRRLQRVDELDFRLRRRDVRLRIADARRKLETAGTSALHSIELLLAACRARLDLLSARLIELSPLRILERGYAIVEDEAGRLLKDSAAVPVDSMIGVRMAGGRLKARVVERSTPDGS